MMERGRLDDDVVIVVKELVDGKICAFGKPNVFFLRAAVYGDEDGTDGVSGDGVDVFDDVGDRSFTLGKTPSFGKLRVCVA